MTRQEKRDLALAYAEEYDRATKEFAADQLVSSSLFDSSSLSLINQLWGLSDRDLLLVGHIGGLPEGEIDLLRQALTGPHLECPDRKGGTISIPFPFRNVTCIATARCEADCPLELRSAFQLHVSLKARPIEEVLAKLSGLIGLQRVKRDVLELVNYIKVQQLRKSKGLKTSELSQHLVFYGNPGTGKTTVRAGVKEQHFRRFDEQHAG